MFYPTVAISKIFFAANTTVARRFRSAERDRANNNNDDNSDDNNESVMFEIGRQSSVTAAAAMKLSSDANITRQHKFSTVSNGTFRGGQKTIVGAGVKKKPSVGKKTSIDSKKFSVHSVNSVAFSSCGSGNGNPAAAAAATTVADAQGALRLTPRVIYVRSESASHAITLVLLLLPIVCVLLLLIGVVFILSHDATLPPFINLSGTANSATHFLSGRVVRFTQNLSPLLYELDLQVYLPYRSHMDFGVRNFTVAGHLILYLHCNRSTSIIQLHAMNLTVDYEQLKIAPTELRASSIVGTGGGERLISEDDIKIVAVAFDVRTTVLELRVSPPLHAGRQYALELSYLALINRPPDGGLFHTFYMTESGEKRLLVGSQMQSLDARRLFPCLDQPAFKARFALRVRYPTGLRAISNMQERVETRHFSNGWSVSEFEPTPKMSTYLFALALTDIPYKETTYKNYKIRVWVQPSKLAHVDYALQVAAHSLQFFEAYFRIPYPLEKLDIVGLPALRVAAMENWGLIFCQQQSILYAKSVHSARNRQHVSDVIAHEIAHMWFGNLVTMEWWDDLWLNEGFATIMAMKAADFAENTTSRTNELFYEYTVKAFRFDQMPNQAHPLSHPADTMQEIKRRFNRITYLKAAAILRMIEGVVGPDIFQRGLQIFLNKFAYGSAKSNDLLNTLSETLEENDPDRIQQLPLTFTPPLSTSASPPALVSESSNEKLSLIELMHEWIYHTGFPLITVDNRRETLQKKGAQISIAAPQPRQQPPTKAHLRSRWRARQTPALSHTLRQTPFLTLLEEKRENATKMFDVRIVGSAHVSPAQLSNKGNETFLERQSLRRSDRTRRSAQSVKPSASKHRHNFRWKVPLFIDSARRKNYTKVVWMLSQNSTVNLDEDELIDLQSYGYYRLLYRDYEPIIARLRADHRSLWAVSRARLLEDTFTLARVGLLPYATTFRVCEYLANETDYLPLLVFNNHIQMLYLLLSRKRADAKLIKAFAVRMLRPAYHKVFADNFEPTDNSETLREFLMTQLCHWQYEPCVREARSQFARLRENCLRKNLSDASCNQIPPELRAPIYGAGVQLGTLADFKFLEEKHTSEPYETERNRMISGFASTQNASLVNYTLTRFISRFHQRPALKEELIDFLHKLMKSSILVEIRDYIRLNFGDLVRRIQHPQVMRIFLAYVTKWTYTEEDVKQLSDFEKRFTNELQAYRMTPYMEELKMEMNANQQFMHNYAHQIIEHLRT